MTRRVVRLSHQAREDLDTITEPLSGVVLRRLDLLSRFPDIGAPLSGPLAGWRSSVVSPFRIIYRAAPDGPVEIAYIRHGRRAPPSPPGHPTA